MALLNLGEDPWLLEHDSCERLHRDIMEQLTLQQKEPKSTQKFSQLSASIRLRLKQYNTETSQLKQKLDQAAKSRSITYDEVERRSRQVETLESKGKQLQRMFDEPISKINQSRNQLMGAAGVSSWDDDELIGRDTSQYTVGQLRSEQKQMIHEQDTGLENLSKIIARQKNIAQTISDEVDLQNDIIDDLGDHIERTDVRVSNETRHIGTVDRKDKTCIYWVIIILLFISIITVATI